MVDCLDPYYNPDTSPLESFSLNNMEWCVYIIECRDGTLYTGVAKELEARIAQHNAGKGAKYTRGRGPVTLLYSESVGDRGTALRREIAVKRMTRAKKLALINSGAA